MMPIYFGPSDRALYGVYHPPHGSSPGAFLICQPVGGEYFNAHRCCRLLARRMSEAGSHVLRFDYSGTGDSSGELEDVDSRDWLKDVGVAIEELEDMAGVRSVGLIGLRTGASLALATALQSHGTRRLVLWDPLAYGEVSGPEYALVPACERVLAASPDDRLAEVLVLRSTGATASPEGIDRDLRSRSSGFESVSIDERGAWEADGGIGTVPIPAKSIEAIVTWCRTST